MNDNVETKRIELKDLAADRAAQALGKSENVRPYFELMTARIKGENTAPLEAAIKALPLEKRYAWRILQALEWGLADCDSETLKMDLAVLPQEKIDEIRKQLKLRLLQLQALIEAVGRGSPSVLGKVG